MDGRVPPLGGAFPAFSVEIALVSFDYRNKDGGALFADLDGAAHLNSIKDCVRAAWRSRVHLLVFSGSTFSTLGELLVAAQELERELVAASSSGTSSPSGEARPAGRSPHTASNGFLASGSPSGAAPGSRSCSAGKQKNSGGEKPATRVGMVVVAEAGSSSDGVVDGAASYQIWIPERKRGVDGEGSSAAGGSSVRGRVGPEPGAGGALLADTFSIRYVGQQYFSRCEQAFQTLEEYQSRRDEMGVEGLGGLLGNDFGSAAWDATATSAGGGAAASSSSAAGASGAAASSSSAAGASGAATSQPSAAAAPVAAASPSCAAEASHFANDGALPLAKRRKLSKKKRAENGPTMFERLLEELPWRLSVLPVLVEDVTSDGVQIVLLRLQQLDCGEMLAACFSFSAFFSSVEGEEGREGEARSGAAAGLVGKRVGRRYRRESVPPGVRNTGRAGGEGALLLRGCRLSENGGGGGRMC